MTCCVSEPDGFSTTGTPFGETAPAPLLTGSRAFAKHAIAVDREPLLPVVHRDLVEALEGRAEGTGVGADEWKRKVESAIGDGGDEAARRVGREIFLRYSRKPVGRALLLSLELIGAERVWSTVFPFISARLRRDIEVDWTPLVEGAGGRVQVTGPRVTPPAVTLGVFQALGLFTRPRTTVALVDVTRHSMTFEMRW